MIENKCIAVLGATGSVGAQSLDVARKRGYRVDFISANRDVDKLESFAREFSPSYVGMADEYAARDLKNRLADTKTTVLSGGEGILFGIDKCRADSVINAITGAAGLKPTLAVIDKGARLCLANKESLVMAGGLVMARKAELGASIIPVDSEHSAIFQSLRSGGTLKKIILTASGGPFRKKTPEELMRVSVSDTLMHPTWNMGQRITVDSATLMNKGFEVIEAAHLFGVSGEKIEVVVHPESILHSAVEYVDNAVIGQLSVPDMRLCIQYAVDYPERVSEAVAPLDFTKVGSLTFEAPNTEAFPLLSLAYRALDGGDAMGAVLNAADEVAVSAFLSGNIGFVGIFDLVYKTYERMSGSVATDIEDILAIDNEARKIAKSLIDSEIRRKN